MSSTDLPQPSLTDNWHRPKQGGVRAIVTGQVGLDKKPFLDHVVHLARGHGHEVTLVNVGEHMYAEAPDVVPGRILDLPRNRLNTLRRSVFKDVLALARTGVNLLINTHATFRWKHGLFHGYDHHQIAALDPDLYVVLVDNVDAVHERLQREHDVPHTLKDILVWREEEVVVTEAMGEAVSGHGQVYIVSRANERITAESVYRLMFEPQRKRVYPSFPITHVLDLPDVLAEIEAFRDTLAEHFITFDPADMDEKRLLFEAGEAAKRGEDHVAIVANGRPIRLPVREITEVARDIDAQIYARDFKMIDQSDIIVSYIPALPTGRPVLSSGVERELQHAHENTKEVYIIWRPKLEPSPFVTQTATRLFQSVAELLTYFQERGYLRDFQLRFPVLR
ncbi:MAG TPA: AAA family ATPase [Phycisphaerae bacterium]|nr:AAA family ATPase [Phycisphaerae bacterium]HNU46959.1 AAA family ATPase [Phycisphaerae bacterium]